MDITGFQLSTTPNSSTKSSYKGKRKKEEFNTNPNLIDVDKDCRVLEREPTNQTLPLIVTPMTAAKPGDPVVPTPYWIRNHPAYNGGWRTLQYFRKSEAKGSYLTYIHKDHGTIRSKKKVLNILDSSLHSLKENGQNLAPMSAPGNDANHLAEENTVVGATQYSGAKHGEVNTGSHSPRPRAMPVYKGSAADSSVLPPPHLSMSNVQAIGDGFCKMQPGAASENAFLNDSDDDSDSN